MTVQFDEEKQNKRLDEFKKEEEEAFVENTAETTHGIPSINLSRILVENDALRLVPEEVARRLGVAPFKLLGRQLHIAIKAPGRDDVQTLLESLKEKGFIVYPYMASSESLEKAWMRYKELSFALRVKAGSLDISEESLVEIRNATRSIEDVRAIALDVFKEKNGRSISRLLEVLLGSAIAINSSDVHIEPEKEEIRVRFRLDGILHDILTFEEKNYKLLNSRIKLLSGLKLTTSDAEQDGRFSIFLEGKEINIRTSLVPGAYGESIVMRILNPDAIQVTLEELGIEKNLFALLDQEIRKPNGLMLLTGPTGSGKTTTLYAFLKRIYSSDIKIITIEDPIEYHLDGITQTQVESDLGYTFLEGLRGALRQDPDVIMVGEIRDEETAKIAINSALTGHLVLSTLHTNNAAGVIPRLIDLGVNPKILTSALTVSLAQRLVRKICQSCKEAVEPTDKNTAVITRILDGMKTSGKDITLYGIKDPSTITLYKGRGCDACHNIGYKGRIGVFEAIKTDSEIEKIVTENPSEREIKKIANAQGMLTMQEDGIIKVLLGVTTLEEVSRVVDLDAK